MTPLRVLLFAIPFIWSIGCVPFVNRVEPFVFGFPFLAFWELVGTIVAFFCIGALYTLDTKKNQ